MHNAHTNMAFQINYIWIRMNVFGFGRLLIDSWVLLLHNYKPG